MAEPELFIVRVWSAAAGDFRASVRRVDEEETRHFSRPEDVTRCLITGAQRPDRSLPDAGSVRP